MLAFAWARKLRVIIPLLSLLVILAALVSVGVGAVPISPLLVFKIIVSKIPLVGSSLVNPDWPATLETIVWDIRIPRILLAILVGAALSTGGVAFQGLLRNPLAEPYTVGVSSGSAVGAALVIVFGFGGGKIGLLFLPLAAFVGAFLTILGVYRVAAIEGRIEVETLILAGVAVSSFMTALLSFFMTLAGENLKQLIFWLMGSFALRGWDHAILMIPYLVVGFTLIWVHYRELNILNLGDESAGQLGVEVERTKIILLFSATLMAAGAVALAGTVGFVGLTIPHIMRLILGPDHRVLVPAAALAGALFLLAADTLARTILAPIELPVGVVTAILGAPFFAYLLRRYRKTRRI